MSTVTKDSGGYMPKRAKSVGSDLRERLRVVGSMLLFAICGFILMALLFVGAHGWLLSLGAVVVFVLLFLFWPHITSLVHHKPKRAK